jgi:nucleotide-binding universal stress UspA family protein
VPLRGNELVLAHVIDTGVRGEMGLERGRHLSRPIPRQRLRQVGEAEQEAAAEALDEARAVVGRLGASASSEIGEGEPGRILSSLAAERGCGLVVVASRLHRENGPGPGPRSVGHTARFVLDHSPCPVLLIRGDAASQS